MADYYTVAHVTLDVGTEMNVKSALAWWQIGKRTVDGDDIPFREEFKVLRLDDSTCIHIGSNDGTFNPDAVINFVYLCASIFKLTGKWGFAYANVCDPPRPNGFGGGAILLDLAGDPESPGCVLHLSTSAWLEEHLAPT